MGLRMEEQGRLAAQGLVEGERLKQALSAQAGAFAALRDECDSAQREQSALLAARGEREVHFAAREGALEARAAELADALALASRAAGGKAAEAARMAAELDGARLDLGRERVVREAAEAASTRAAAELSRLCDESGGRPDSAGAEGVQELARAELAQAEVRTAALQAKLDALRGQAAEAARARESAGGSAEQMLARAVAGTDGERGGRSNPATEAERARVQLDTLAKLLSEQQELVAQVNSDRSALKLELEAETKRRRSAEQLHSHSRKATAGEDIESGGGGERLTPAARMQLKRRWAHRPNVAKVMEVVDEAAQLIDRGSLQTTRFLSHNPYVRLMVACYVFILHLWVLVVLMHLAPGHYRHSNKLHAPAAGTMPPSVMLT
ncbi:hypothetical protein T492DRAFT_1017288 [Pavlovales sp. CCMP2436]|nr:hypothetical protein T492DRAFT_1017288 [Pavlovales sp. CCMP2436]